MLELIIVFTLLAQRSLYVHVEAVAFGFIHGGIEGGRKAVSMIVGRDPKMLDESGVSRAAIESLAENFSDGVVAPVFWYGVFGLPGILVYKMINTADSMIGYKNDKYLWFGRVAAQVDDLANWLPARLSGLLIAGGVLLKSGVQASKNSVSIMFRDAGLHASPNAGWPESAMAGGLNIALGGPRKYPQGEVRQVYLNSSGKRKLGLKEIDDALNVFSHSCYVGWTLVIVLVILF